MKSWFFERLASHKQKYVMVSCVTTDAIMFPVMTGILNAYLAHCFCTIKGSMRAINARYRALKSNSCCPTSFPFLLPKAANGGRLHLLLLFIKRRPAILSNDSALYALRELTRSKCSLLAPRPPEKWQQPSAQLGDRLGRGSLLVSRVHVEELRTFQSPQSFSPPDRFQGTVDTYSLQAWLVCDHVFLDIRTSHKSRLHEYGDQKEREVQAKQ